MDEVTLVQHVGKMRAPRNDPLGREFIEVDLNQWCVMLNGTKVGYLGKEEGAGVNFIRRYDKTLIDTVLSQCESLTGKKDMRHSRPPDPEKVIQARKERDQEEDEDDES